MIQSKLEEMKELAEKLEKEYKEQFGVNPPKLPKTLGNPDFNKKELTVSTPKQQPIDARKKSIEPKPRSESKELMTPSREMRHNSNSKQKIENDE